MGTFRRLAVGSVLLLGSAIVGCGTPEKGEEATVQKRSALTTSLFEAYVSYPTGSSAEAVAIGDLDGDGRNDLAVVTTFSYDPANDYTLHVFLQAADGTLQPRVKYPVGKRSHSIDIGDVNGDGRADVVVGMASGSGIEIGVLRQNASGTLDPMVSYPTPNSNQVKVGDFNDDGRVDIAGINHGAHGDGLDVFLQDETGALAPPVTYHVPHGGSDELDAGDIDGDGRTDIIVMSGQSYDIPDVSVLLQTPEGTLGAPTSFSLAGNVNAGGIGLGDTNGDGRTDIVVSHTFPTPSITRFLQNEQGTFDPATYASYFNPSAIVVADVDGDGRKDVLVAHRNNSLGVYRQFPSGELVSEELYTIPNLGLYPQTLAVGDINGDSLPDAVIACPQYGLVVLRHVNDTQLALAISEPRGGLYGVGLPIAIRWVTGDTVPLAGFDASVSLDNGSTYTPIAECTGLPGTARECSWTASTVNSATRIRVTARDTAGQTASAETTFNVAAPTIIVASAVSPQFVGTTTTFTWAHNLPPADTVRIQLSRNGGVNFETLEAAAPNTGSFAWTITGPQAFQAQLRVTSNGSTPAAGSTSFAILTPALTVSAPTAGTTVYAPNFFANWTHNVGAPAGATVRVEVSRDGGTTYETIAAAAPDIGRFIGPVPGSGPDTTNARIRITTNGPVTATGTSAPFTLITPTAVVTNPVPGAVLYSGTPAAITWASNLPATWTVRVELTRNGGSTFEVLAGFAPNTGSFPWSVTGPAAADVRVRISIGQIGQPPLVTATGDSFAVLTPSLTVTSPTAGATLYAGTSVPISWSTNLPAEAPVDLTLSRDGGVTFEPIAVGVPNTGSFAWTVTGPDAALAVVRVAVSGAAPLSASSGAFAITTPGLTVAAPAAGALVYAGTPVTITWTDNVPAGDPVSIEVSRDGGATFEPIAAAEPDTGSFVWTATGPDAAEARVRVTSLGALPASGVSAAFQIAVPAVTVTSPTTGASWAIGTARTISWSSSNLPAGDTVDVALSRDGGASWTTLASAQPASGSLPWTATSPATTTALVRVVANGGVPASGTSGAFAIGNPAVTVTSPATGASWTIGANQTITWSTNLLPTATVRIRLSRDGGSTFTTLASEAPNTGSFTWKASGAATTNAIVRVVAIGSNVTGVSGVFSLVAGKVTVTAPNTFVTWPIGTAQTITWAHNAGAGAAFKIEVSRSGVWSVISAAAPAGETSGSYSWTVIGPTTANAKVRVTWTSNTAAKDTSDVAFRIN